jgi:hypothetical protein
MKKVGRNNPCPCGSGKKYKKCCLSKPLSDSQRAESFIEQHYDFTSKDYKDKEREFSEWVKDILHRVHYTAGGQSIALEEVWTFTIVPGNVMPLTGDSTIYQGLCHFDTEDDAEGGYRLINPRIWISRSSLVVLPIDYVKDVFLHELAHALQAMHLALRQQNPALALKHNEIWRDFCNMLGVKDYAGAMFDESIGLDFTKAAA